MSWSFSLGRVSNIDIRIHFTFFFILLLGAVQWGGLGSGQAALFGVLVTALLFVCVLLHELGHSLVAQRFGIPVKEILLMPLGGVAMLARNPEKPLHELLIAIAGPLVNVVIGGALLAVSPLLNLDPSSLLAGVPTPGLDTLVWWLLAANVGLVVFNLIPAFPLDGGRVFRALLAMRLGTLRATQIATRVGQSLAVALGLLGLFTGNLILVMIAFFVFFGAAGEGIEAQARDILGRIRARDAANRQALTLSIGDRLSMVVPLMMTTGQKDFAVMHGSQPIGILTEGDVRRAAASGLADAYVTGLMQREILRVNADMTLYEVRQALLERQVTVAAVYEGDLYLGLVSMSGINDILRLWLSSRRPASSLPSQSSGTAVGRI